MSCPILSRLSLDIVGISVTDRCDAATSAPRPTCRLRATVQAARAHRLGQRAHNGSGDERPDIFAFRGNPLLSRRRAARRRASVCLISCPLRVSRLDVSLLSIGPLSGLLGIGPLGGRLGSGRCGDWQPPSSCNPHLSVLSNDFAGFALFSGGKREGITTIGKQLPP